MFNNNFRQFSSEVQEVEKPEQEIDINEQRRRIGVDMEFSNQKHGYVLTFPWNFNEVIEAYEQDFRPLPENSYWYRYCDASNSFFEFNKLFREFHQWCTIPDFEGLEIACEGKLAAYVQESIKRIQFHGLDIEMANLTVL